MTQLGAAASVADPAAAAGDAQTGRSPGQVAKQIGLFFVAPIVTMAYLMLFPLIAAALVTQSFRQSWQLRHPDATAMAKTLAAWCAVPFIGLVYLMLFPFIGLALVARTVGIAWRQHNDTI